MRTIGLCLLMPFLLASSVLAGPGPEIVNPEEVGADPDFAIQGEYLGKGALPEGEESQVGAQVIALGDGQFRLVAYRGGLPGAGWQRGDPQFALEGNREGDVVTLSGDALQGKIERGKLTLTGGDDKTLAQLTRTERTSPTLAQKPPKGAVVLFDGTGTEHFPDGTLTDMQTLEAGTTAGENSDMQKLHLEFRLSWKPQARGQRRSNSGVYIGGIPEIQVLDSFGLEGRQNECGAFYGRREPDVNMCLSPLVWQTFDVEFTAPPRDGEGRPQGNILVTVQHNGVVIHQDYDTRKTESNPRRLHLQRHGNRVQYRNIWLVENAKDKP